MGSYGIVVTVARVVAVALWAGFVAVLVLEGADDGGAVIGPAWAMAVSYALTLAVMTGLPRRSAIDVVVVSVLVMAGPEIVAAAFHGVGGIRIVLELLAVAAAVLPVKIDRLARGVVVTEAPPLLGSMTVTRGARRSWVFNLRPRPRTQDRVSLGASDVTGRVQRLPGRESVIEGSE